MRASYPSTADDWRELAQAFWNASLVMKRIGMRDIKGELMHPRFAEYSKECTAEYLRLDNSADNTGGI